ncbi:MAG TPA: ATP-binding protein, partial [Coleofasciculaceae cyanobacterium]
RFASEKWSIAANSAHFRLRLDTSAHAAAAGFWYLHKGLPHEAAEAFAVKQVHSVPYGEEMFTLANTIAVFYDADELATIAILPLPNLPKVSLRPDTWKAVASLCQVVEEVQIVQRSVSRAAQSFALNRALGKLTDLLDKDQLLPEAERELIRDIAQAWKEALLRVASKVGEISITEQVRNPYVVGDPVEGNLFVGREDILRQLEEFWVMGHHLQSVVLYGHRRMGKTSILRNAANCLGSEVKVAYINLLNMGATSQGVGEVLMAITDAISDATGCTPPPDAELLNIPYRTFERYLKQVGAHLSGGLIVALDEFEKIEELIEAQKIPKDFMGYLRGLVQMSSKVAFAFAGLHTLEEMTADYFQPFFASVIPIHVGFLQPGATRQILANPDEEFPLDYTPEALDQIYALTAGQPYLVQLVGFQLVRRYNDYVFEQGRPRDPVFTVEDVETVINDPELFKRGRYYFDGVWGQAARGASGQQAILKALAPHPEGLSIDALAQVTAMEEETLQEALKTLKRHDVVQEREGGWQIIVELFRRWVLQS